MPKSKYRISRTTTKEGQLSLIFEPPLESRELHESLELAYPSIKHHCDRVRQAIVDFITEETGILLQTFLSPQAKSLHPQLPLKQQNSVPCGSTKSFPKGHISSNHMPLSYMDIVMEGDKSVTSTRTQDKSTFNLEYAQCQLQGLESSNSRDLFTVWDSRTDNDVKCVSKRRRMGPGELENFRRNRQLGACSRCRKDKRKCRHNDLKSFPGRDDTTKRDIIHVAEDDDGHSTKQEDSNLPNKWKVSLNQDEVIAATPDSETTLVDGTSPRGEKEKATTNSNSDDRVSLVSYSTDHSQASLFSSALEDDLMLDLTNIFPPLAPLHPGLTFGSQTVNNMNNWAWPTGHASIDSPAWPLLPSTSSTHNNDDATSISPPPKADNSVSIQQQQQQPNIIDLVSIRGLDSPSLPTLPTPVPLAGTAAFLQAPEIVHHHHQLDLMRLIFHLPPGSRVQLGHRRWKVRVFGG